MYLQKKQIKRIMSAIAVVLTVIVGVVMVAGFVSRADNNLKNNLELSSIAPISGEYEAEYLGVNDYGKPETNKDNKNNFLYRFSIGGEEVILKMWNGTADSEGNYDYPLQNRLKEGYRYKITIEDERVVDVKEIESGKKTYDTVVKGTPGVKTVSNFLMNTLAPVGTSLYIYGGAWDWQDVGSSIQSRTIGVPMEWVTFFNSKDADFTYKGTNPETSYYPYGEYNEYYYAGPDCSGYVGWVIYNTLNTQSGLEGYVGSARNMAKNFADKGFGTWTKEYRDESGKLDFKPGDIMSISDHHIWISLGTCDDGSILIAHCSPSKSRNAQPGAGAQLSAIGDSTECEAYKLAEQYMSKYYPSWYERYPIYLTDPGVYLDVEKGNAGRLRWDNNFLADPENIQNMSPKEVLAHLYSENNSSDSNTDSDNNAKTVKVNKAPKTGDGFVLGEMLNGLEEARIVHNYISDEEYNAIVARENANKKVKLTDAYWSSFSEPYYNYVDKMSAMDKQVYDKIYDALYAYIDGGADFSLDEEGYYVTPYISCGNIEYGELECIAYLLLYNHPEIFYIDNRFDVDTSESGESAIRFAVYDDFAKGQDRKAAARNLRDRIEWYISQASGTSIYDKEKKLHDLICKNVEYNENNIHNQSSYSALVEKESVCAGYSEAYAMLCHAIGIPAVSVTSKKHEWNMVKMGDVWYLVDVTWDDEGNPPLYDYFDKSEETVYSYDEASQENHTVENVPWDTVGVPTCPKDYTREQDSVKVYRLYNKNSGEHFYTTSYNEKEFLEKAGWNYEDVGWIAPIASYSKRPVYRLYSPAGDHHYTTSYAEKEYLVNVGWSYEDVCWYSTNSRGVSLYRLYNPNASVGAHHYTTSEAERDNLINAGWSYEGVGWNGV